MQIKFIYRNYKPLHDLYNSLLRDPPKKVDYLLPKQKRFLRPLLPLYKQMNNLEFVRFVTSKIQRLFFETKDDTCDLYHVIQMVLERIPKKPYVVDFEHISAITGYSQLTSFGFKKILNFFDNTLCCKIIPLTNAAHNSMIFALQDSYENLEEKTQVVYPALPNYYSLFRDKIDYTYLKPDNAILQLLFVGNGIYRKGLPELLIAFQNLKRTHHDLYLYVISDAPRNIVKTYESDRIKFFPPQFSHQEIVKQFFLPADLFVLPTHSDSFGMASLYALSSGTPVLTTAQFANPEIVDPGNTGIFVDSDRLYLDHNLLPNRSDEEKYYGKNLGPEEKLVKELEEKIDYFHNCRDLLDTMGKKAVKEFEPGGKFSIGVRNRKLKYIYESCLSAK